MGNGTPLVSRVICGGVVVALVVASVPARAGLTVPSGFRDTLVAGDFRNPTGIAFVPDPPFTRIRALVVEQLSSRVNLVSTSPINAANPIGIVPDVLWGAGEQGLLSIAVDARWPARPFIYVHYTSQSHMIHLTRFRLSGDLANTGDGSLTMDVASRMLVIDIPDSMENHNGGALRFGPDGMLYYSTGDDRRDCPAQDTTTLFGKLLRLDVSALPDTGAGPVPRALLVPADNPHASSPDSNFRLVHSVGLRNPFRFHIDPANGAIFIADVGHVSWEEIDRITGPANLGWPWREGPDPFTTCSFPPPGSFTSPVVSVPHPDAVAIISLGVYRAPAEAASPFPAEYDGDYFFGDFLTGIVRRVGFDGSAWVAEPAPGQPTSTEWATSPSPLVDGLVGRDGALWYVLHSLDYSSFFNGQVRRIEWVGPDTVLAAPAPPRATASFELPRPNPARGVVSFAYTLERAANVELTVYDAGGRLVRRIERGLRSAGRNGANWDGRDGAGLRVGSCLYVARLKVGEELHVHRLVLTR